MVSGQNVGGNGLAMLGYPKLLFFDLFFGENYGERTLDRGDLSVLETIRPSASPFQTKLKNGMAPTFEGSVHPIAHHIQHPLIVVEMAVIS